MLVRGPARLGPQVSFVRRAADGRSEAEIRQHYLVERELADRLRNAPDAERRGLYPKVYEELFRRLPHHPQLRARFHPDAHARRMRDVEWQFRFLRHALGLRKVFLEVGAGDCALARRVSGFVERAFAVDVSEEVMRIRRRAANVVPVLSDGVSIPVPAGSVHVAFSNQLMEHLHPRDAAAQLDNIYRALAPGGRYFCVTPNRLYGPRDVSAHFDPVATGLHLKEYCSRELRALLLQAGFRKVRFHAGARGLFVRVPGPLIHGFESCLSALPSPMRKALADNPPARALLGLYAEAIR